jgi:hypothetical protein
VKVVEPTQTKPTPFRDGIPKNKWCFWFKCKHPQLNIKKVMKYVMHKVWLPILIVHSTTTYKHYIVNANPL